MARLENCPTCNKAISENALSCPSCGEPLMRGWADVVLRKKKKEESQQKKAFAAVAGGNDALDGGSSSNNKLVTSIFFVAILIATFVFIMGEDESDNRNFVGEVSTTKNLQEIEKIEAEVALVPASDYMKNIELYGKLRALNPENQRYTDKIAHYEKLEEKRKGFHCLSSWDGSHRGVKSYVEERTRDPDSFDHIETRITPVGSDGTHVLTMRYRARNGFGGMTVGAALASVSNSDCSATVLSVE